MRVRSPWRPDPRRGRARGVAAFGPSGFDDPAALGVLFHEHRHLGGWLAQRGLPLRHERVGLSDVDSLLDQWRDDPEIGPMVTNEVGLFVGCVLADLVPEAHWAVWPNGHPIVADSGRELDVIDIVRRRLETGAPHLPDVLDEAAARS